jgi:hypothetical protein
MKDAAPSDDSGRDGGESQLSLDFGEGFSPSSRSVNSAPVPLSGLLRKELETAKVAPAALAALEYVPLPVREHNADCLRRWTASGEGILLFFSAILIYRTRPGDVTPLGPDTVARIARERYPSYQADNSFAAFDMRAVWFARCDLRPLIALPSDWIEDENADCNAIFRAGWRPDKWEGGNSWS